MILFIFSTIFDAFVIHNSNIKLPLLPSATLAPLNLAFYFTFNAIHKDPATAYLTTVPLIASHSGLFSALEPVETASSFAS